MKPVVVIPFMIAAFGLSACGLRGDLERPDPLWGEPKEVVKEAPKDEASKVTEKKVAEQSYRDPKTGEIVWVENGNGGYKPLAKPVKPITDTGTLPPIED